MKLLMPCLRIRGATHYFRSVLLITTRRSSHDVEAKFVSCQCDQVAGKIEEVTGDLRKLHSEELLHQMLLDQSNKKG